MRTISFEEITRITETFLDATISGDNFHHREHIIVGLELVRRHGCNGATDKMRNGIRGLLKALNVDNSKYHETLTVFWIKALSEFYENEKDLPFEDLCVKAVAEFPPDFPQRFYRQETLGSEIARTRFIEPDIS